MTEREMVEDFHRAMGLPVRTTPTMPSEAERLMRAKLIHEESGEAIRALGCRTFTDAGGTVHVVVDPRAQPALVDATHELNDLLYVAHGGLAEMGAPPDVFVELHRANMSKLGDDERPVLRADGKAMKGPRYRPPDVAGVLAREYAPCPACGHAPHWERGTRGTAPHSYCSVRHGWNSPNCGCDHMPCREVAP